MGDHHHFICTRCGTVRDFASRSMDGLSVPAEARSLGDVRSLHVQARGICNECARGGPAPG
jgi:Fur family peroxide stress response transcriptional regulator